MCEPSEEAAPESERLRVLRDDAAGRYVLRRDDETIGFADFHDDDDVVVVPYVEIRADLRGHGLGDVLARGLLEDLRAAGRDVLPLCGFLAGFVREHPEFHGLTAGR